MKMRNHSAHGYALKSINLNFIR